MATRSRSSLVRRAAVLLVGILGCERVPTTPSLDFRLVRLSDGSVAAGSHFYFLPPIGHQASFSGDFDGSQWPVVRICEMAGGSCRLEVAAFSRTSGTGGQLVTVDSEMEWYQVNWKTWQIPNYSPDKTRTYRIRVSVGAQELGFADVWVGPSFPTIPIKFRIEQGAVTPPPPAPVASFTFSCVDLACSFDASGSTAQADAARPRAVRPRRTALPPGAVTM